MYILLIVLYLSGNGKAIHVEKIEFATEKMCQAAKEKVDANVEPLSLSGGTSCLRVR